MMARLAPFFRRLNEPRAAVTVEFALLSTLFFAMMLGVLQVGIGMQAYNAIRNASADVARYTMVQYESGNKISNSQIRAYAISTAKSTPYLLENARLNAQVQDASTQRVTGAKEITLTITYRLPSLITVLDIYSPNITYSRPIFILQ
ncbi:MAG: pilus assembly protein [Betaproteobacteria bacterium]|nr:pilus assembly protein [Paracoccaceae bacterium]MBD3814031.1 pilus assembly protein [Betaproteobacteria bacterium]